MSGVYGAPQESTIYADVSVEAAAIEAVRGEASITAWVAQAAAYAMQSVPEANVVWRRGRFRPRDEISTWIYGTNDAGHVTGGLVTHAFQGIAPIEKRIRRIAVKKGDASKADGKKIYRLLSRVTPRALGRWLRLYSWHLHDRGRSFKGIGPSGFGSVGITNVGSLGIPTAPAIPIPPFARHVVMLSVGALQDHAWVRDGQVEAGRRLPITASLDHRAFVGLAAGRLMAAFQDALTDPALMRRLADG